MSWQDVLNALNLSSQLAGIIGLLPIFYSACGIYSIKKYKTRQLALLKQSPGARPAVFIVNIGTADIEAQVRSYTNVQLPQDIHWVYYHHKGMVEADNIIQIMREIEQEYEKVLLHGADRIHFFYKGPVPLAAMVGDLLSNGMPVLVYHLDTNSGYQCWGSLRSGR